MKLKLTMLCIAFSSIGVATAQNFSLQSSDDQAIIFSHEFDEKEAIQTQLGSQSFWDFDKTYRVTTQEKSAPALPTFAESVIIPNYGSTSLLIEHGGYTDHENVLVTPSKGSLKRNINPSTIPYEFGTVYATDAFYPANIAELSSPYNLRNTRGVTVRISPYQYNPVTKTLRVYHNIQVKVLIDKASSGINELAGEYLANDRFREIYDDHYLNADAIFGRYSPVEEEGDLLIITDDQFTNEIQPFVDWKVQSGIKTTVVTTATAGTTDTGIKAYIQNFYASNPNLVHVLFVGDHAQVPSHTYGSSGWEQLWSDSYYGQMTADYYPELFVGRLSGTTSGHITTQVDRILEYEKTPASGTWMEGAIGLGSNEGAGYGDDGQADWQHLRAIRTKLLAHNYSQVYEFYDGSHGGDDASGNPNSADISTAVNAGVGLFNYTGHGDLTTCITGNFGASHVNSATNNGMYPFVISVACNNGTFTSGTCISESWMQAMNGGSPTGSIAACGSTILMAWAEPMQTQDEMTEIITEAYATNKKATLGGIFYNAQMSMLEDYSSSATAVEVMQTWVMFGDPSTLFRNKQSMNMSVSHVSNVPLATASVTINCDVDGAMVTIVQDGNILGKAPASGGTAVINFTPLTSNLPLIVTAVKQNYVPYQGVITVADGPAGLEESFLDHVKVYPVPATDFITVNWDHAIALEEIQIIDLAGKQLFVSDIAPMETSKKVNTANLSSGVYLLKLTSAGVSKTTRISIR